MAVGGALLVAFLLGRALAPSTLLLGHAEAAGAWIAAYMCRDALQELDARHTDTVSALLACREQREPCPEVTPAAAEEAFMLGTVLFVIGIGIGLLLGRMGRPGSQQPPGGAVEGVDEMFRIPDDFPDFQTRIVAALRALDAEGQELTPEALGGLVYIPRTSDEAVISRAVDGGDAMLVNNHVGAPGTCEIWSDVAMPGENGRVVGSTPRKRFEVTTGAIASIEIGGEDFSQAGLPEELPDA